MDSTPARPIPELKASGEARQITLREFYTVIFVHKMTIVVSFVILLAGILWGLSLRKQEWIASIKYFVNRNYPYQTSIRYVGRTEWEEEINSIAELGRSQGVLVTAAKSYFQARGWENPPPHEIVGLASGMVTKVEVVPVAGTDIINILVHDEDPDTALMLAEIYGRNFVREFKRIYHPEHSREFFLSAMDGVENKIMEANEAKVAVQEAYNLYAWHQEEISLTDARLGLIGDLTKLRRDRQMLETQVELERSQGAQDRNWAGVLTSRMVDDPLINTTEMRISELELELDGLRGLYTDDHRLVRGKLAQVEAVKAERAELIARKAQEHVQAIVEMRSGENVLEAAIAEIEERLAVIPDQAGKLEYYTRYIDTQWELYAELVQKYHDTLASEQDVAAENQLVQLGPSNIGGIQGLTPRVVSLLVAPIFALLLAVSIAFMAEATHHSFQKAADLEEFSGLPVLATFRKI